MTETSRGRNCPKCGAPLIIERLDHHLTGQERLHCPRHGDMGALRKPSARDYADAKPDPDEFE